MQDVCGGGGLKALRANNQCNSKNFLGLSFGTKILFVEKLEKHIDNGDCDSATGMEEKSKIQNILE